MTSDRVAMVRAALLAVEEAAGLVDRGGWEDDPLVEAAVGLAAGRQLVTNSASKEKARAAVLRYISRMGGRATPYGLFAGTGFADIGPQRRLSLGSATTHLVRVRPDVGALYRVVLEAYDEAPREKWCVRLNPTVRRTVDGLRYTKPGDAGADVVSLTLTPALGELLKILDGGPMVAEDVVAALRERAPSTDAAALLGFLGKLLDSALLLRCTELLASGEEPVTRAAAILDGLGRARERDAIQELSRETCGPRPLLPEQLPGVLDRGWRTASEAIPALAEVADHHRFHVDVELSLDAAVLDHGTVADLEETLRRLEPVFPPHDGLKDFREAFRRRYEDAEVPLLEVVDLDSGLLKSSQREVSRLARLAGVRHRSGQTVPEVRPALLRALDQWITTGGPVDLRAFAEAAGTTAKSVQAALLDDHEGAYRSMLVAGHRRTSSALLARFSLGRDDVTRRLYDLEKGGSEEASDRDTAIRAELLHSPTGRIGNVLIRPRLFDEAVALSGADGGTLALDRLQIRLVGDELRLRDDVSGRRVLLDLSTAHNVSSPGSDPVYSFLGQLAGTDAVTWAWGALGRLSHLPRVVCGSVIVTPERWRLTGEAVRRIVAAADPARELRRSLPELGERRWVGTGEYDLLLPIDLHSSRSVAAALARPAAAEEHTVFVELPQLESPAAQGAAGGHVAEAVVPLGGGPPTARHQRWTAPPPVSQEAGRGTEWLYFRYFTGVAAADTVVARAQELVRDLGRRGRAEEWFFIRYAEQGHHVRVRVRPAGPDARQDVLGSLDAFGARLRATGLVSDYSMHQYVPEVARYGGPVALRYAEALFAADSDDVAAFVASRPDETARLHHAVAVVLHWCETLFDTHTASIDFLLACMESLGMDFEKDGNKRGKFFREHRGQLDAYLASWRPTARTSARLAEFAGAVREAYEERSAYPSFGSALHMHCNRLFAFDARRLEFLTYDLALRKVRESMARRGARSFRKGTA
ncbi:thiopeptide-type bacteriocin biosynthesis protein [Streptomyces fradiae]|uniref:lantibiotic dehydratase n=1 Tax=Streptomyces fradiae TaxID=1906 RepID=UPI003986533D